MEIDAGSFCWDSEKESENIRRHGVDFITASRVFLDPRRRIVRDSLHSLEEERYFCLGSVSGRILTVRFTYRRGKIRVIGAGYWRKGRREYEKHRS